MMINFSNLKLGKTIGFVHDYEILEYQKNVIRIVNPKGRLLNRKFESVAEAAEYAKKFNRNLPC